MAAPPVADVTAVVGGIGSGKSAYVKQRLKRDAPRRLLIFDPQDEYGAHARALQLRELFRELYAPAWRVRLVPGGAGMAREFDLLCRAAYAAGSCTFVVDELHLVTSPNPARVPAGWSSLVLRSRHRRVAIIGASQRPAHMDKDFLGNATRIRACRLGYGPDCEAVARAMLIRPEEIAGLRPLDWIERDAIAGKITRGRLRF